MTSRFGDRYAREFLAGWGRLDLHARKLVAPPAALAEAMRLIPRCTNFVELPLPGSSTQGAER